MSAEGGFPFLAFGYMEQVVGSMHVKLGKVLGLAQLVECFGYWRQRAAV
jgi:hypothetical protein